MHSTPSTEPRPLSPHPAPSPAPAQSTAPAPLPTPPASPPASPPADPPAETAPDALTGVRDFQRHTAPLLRPELARLAMEGQSPSQLFITCADSRLVPNVITNTGPGELFTVRNIGNLVPPTADDSVFAAVEYAVDVLDVQHVTVCGHSGCGAMRSLLHGAHRRDGRACTPLTRWLRHGQDSLHRVRHNPARFHGRSPSTDPLERLCLTNVVQQLDNLRAHPTVARRAELGTIRLTGLYFELMTAQTYVWSSGNQGFRPVRPWVDTAA